MTNHKIRMLKIAARCCGWCGGYRFHASNCRKPITSGQIAENNDALTAFLRPS